jgi:hypothetical protein
MRLLVRSLPQSTLLCSPQLQSLGLSSGSHGVNHPSFTTTPTLLLACVLCYVALCYVALHCVVLFYLVWSGLVRSCPVWSGPVRSGLVWSCLVWSCLIWSCRVVSCRVVSCRVLSCRVVSCLVLSCLVLSCLDFVVLISFCRLPCLLFLFSLFSLVHLCVPPSARYKRALVTYTCRFSFFFFLIDHHTRVQHVCIPSYRTVPYLI